jgi:hypothetical protein
MDVIAQAQSGTGKTATFSISILQQIDTNLRECQVWIYSIVGSSCAFCGRSRCFSDHWNRIQDKFRVMDFASWIQPIFSESLVIIYGLKHLNSWSVDSILFLRLLKINFFNFVKCMDTV